MIISLIAAHDRNRLIGNSQSITPGGQIPWNLPKDMKYFRETTKHHMVIMGRKTYQTMGKPLPNRTNIVISRKDFVVPNGAYSCSTLEEALDLANKLGESECFVIGGAQIYAAALPVADFLYITTIDAEFIGDVYFPAYPEFTKVISDRVEEENGVTMHFLKLAKE